MRKVILFLCVLSLTCLSVWFNSVQVFTKEKVEIPSDVRAYCEKYGQENYYFGKRSGRKRCIISAVLLKIYAET